MYRTFIEKPRSAGAWGVGWGPTVVGSTVRLAMVRLEGVVCDLVHVGWCAKTRTGSSGLVGLVQLLGERLQSRTDVVRLTGDVRDPAQAVRNLPSGQL